MKRFGWMVILVATVAAIACLFGGCATMPEFENVPTTVDLSLFQSLLQTANKYWPDWKKQIEDGFNQPGPPIQIPSTVQIARSWLNGAAPGGREMNLLANGVSLDDFKKWADDSKAAGCNTMNLFLLNIKDGLPLPTTFYASGGCSGAVDPVRVDLTLQKIDYAYSIGMMLNFWLMADDGGIPYKDEATIKRFFADCKQWLGSRIEGASYLVPILEVDEVLGAGGLPYLNAYAKELHTLFEGSSVGNHMTSGEYDWSIQCPDVDVHFHQEKPTLSIAQFTKNITAVKAKMPKPMISCEHSLNGDSGEAQEKSKIALAVGCIGVHSGVPAK